MAAWSTAVVIKDLCVVTSNRRRMTHYSWWHQCSPDLKIEDDPKNENNTEEEDNLKTEDDPKNKDDPRNDRDPKNDYDPKIDNNH